MFKYNNNRGLPFLINTNDVNIEIKINCHTYQFTCVPIIVRTGNFHFRIFSTVTEKVKQRKQRMFL